LGALTLKSYPYVLRGWEIEKFESLDPTDGFGSTTRVYISKNQIVQIEPDYNQQSLNTWITDKGRQFFDGIFGIWSESKEYNSKIIKKEESLSSTLKKLITKIYLFDLCNKSQNKNHFLVITFEDISLEILTLFNIIAKKYSFVKIKRIEKNYIHNNLESEFKLNSASDLNNIKQSSFCLLVNTNPRYEGFVLNLRLRQRFLKGNFKVFSLGSLLNLTFSTKFLGSNFKTFKTICEGNHPLCQNIKFAYKPIIIVNDNLFKRYDSKYLVSANKLLNYSPFLNSIWYGVNTLNTSIHETGIQTNFKFQHLTEKDLQNFSVLYFVNLTINSSSVIKKAAKVKLLNYDLNKLKDTLKQEKLILDQNSLSTNKLSLNTNHLTTTKHYNFIPVSMFYENSETFINTEGLIKQTKKLIFRKKSSTGWQIIRKIIHLLNNNINFMDKQDNQIIFLKSKNINNFRNFMNFQYYATKSLSYTNCNFNNVNKSFYLYTNVLNYKTRNLKFVDTKLKYWLEDFFNGGKDTYSHSSVILANSSKILRLESTNFF
jgi:NADH dehydrogenase/NADH:ubiquinone oxidoreductase subunit G